MPQELRYLALGDSYTIGEGVEPGESWPWLMVERLRGEGHRLSDPQIIATTGWTTHDLQVGIDEASPVGPFALVTLLVGANNQYQRLGIEEYREELGALLDRAITLADGHPGRVVAISVPDWGVTPHGEGHDRETVAREIDDFNSSARALTVERGSTFVDVTHLSRLALDRPDLIAADDLHPSASMYEIWLDRILPAARDAIS